MIKVHQTTCEIHHHLAVSFSLSNLCLQTGSVHNQVSLHHLHFNTFTKLNIRFLNSASAKDKLLILLSRGCYHIASYFSQRYKSVCTQFTEYIKQNGNSNLPNGTCRNIQHDSCKYGKWVPINRTRLYLKVLHDLPCSKAEQWLNIC